MGGTISRKEFLKVTGAGAAGASLLGVSTLAAGCSHTNPSPNPPNGPPANSGMNVIVVIIDSLRKDHVGAYGSDLMRTPNLDALAKESLRFARAYPEAMPTIPARRAIHTGMRTFPFKDRPEAQKRAPVRGWLPIPEEQPTLAEILKGQGYHTMLVTDTYHEFMPPMNFHRGFDVLRKFRGQEQDHYKDHSSVSEEEMQRYLVLEPTEVRQYLANTQGRKGEEDWFAPKVFSEATSVLEQAVLDGADRGQPFFLVVDCYDPHEPWDPPGKYVSLYDLDGYEGKEPFNPQYGADDYLTNRQLLRMRALYSAEVTMVDHWLGKFLHRAHELGLMNHTLLMVISDHGHLLGEHGYTGKLHYALYPELTDIVFFTRHPRGKRAGQASDYYASTHDVAPTILGFLGVEPPHPMHGVDLSGLLEGKNPEPRDHFTLGYGEHVWCRDEAYVAFCRDDLVGAKLYDPRNDPQLQRDIARDEPETVEKMFEEYVLKDAGGSLPTY
jgi:arylsulfatase A-like enzyme